MPSPFSRRAFARFMGRVGIDSPLTDQREVVLTHLTRMSPGYLCAAGIATDTGEHIRLVGDSRNIPRHYLLGGSNPVKPGDTVSFRGRPAESSGPHVEDFQIDLDSISKTGSKSTAELKELLTGVAVIDFESVFGPDFEKVTERTGGLPPTRGATSLGYVKIEGDVEIRVWRDGSERWKIRLEFQLGGSVWSPPLNDYRVWLSDHQTPNERRINAARNALARANTVVASIGVTRAYAVPDLGKWHWLQINNLYTFKT